MGSHLQQIPFEDFLLYLFNSSSLNHENKLQQQQLVRDFVQLNLNSGISSDSLSRKSKIIVQTSDAMNFPTFVPKLSTSPSTGLKSSLSHLPHVVGSRASPSRTGTQRDSEILKLPLIENFESINNNSNHSSSNERRIRSQRSYSNANRIEELAFYKNFSACAGKRRSKSSNYESSSSTPNFNTFGEINPKTNRLCRSVPIKYINFSQSMSSDDDQLDSDKDMEVEGDGNMRVNGNDDNTLNDSNHFSNNSYHHDHHIHHQDSANKFLTNKSNSTYKKIGLASSSEPSINNMSSTTTARFNNLNSIDLTLNERVEKTMSLYLDAVQMGHSKEYENTSTSVRLFY